MKKIILVLSTILVFIDQIIKYFVTNNLDLLSSIKVIPNFFSITYVRNTGAAFSILSGNRWFLVAIGVIVLFAIIIFVILDKKITKYDTISYSLIIAGSLGNLIDRVCYGSVVDYISFSLFKYNAPIFNFADMCIVIGAFMLLYAVITKGEFYEVNNS